MGLLLSVIIPCYNSEKYIKRAIESVLCQTLQSFEIIVINDASTDGTLEILKEYGNKIVLINNEENIGCGASRNKGLKIASGKYVGFLDNDDFVQNDYFEKMVLKAEAESADVCVTLKIKNHKNGEVKAHKISNKDLKSAVFVERTAPWAKIIKNDFIKENNLEFDTARGEDIYPAFIEAKSAKITYVDDTFYNCTIREDSISHKKITDNDLSEIQVYKKILPQIEGKYWKKLFLKRALISFDFLYTRADKRLKKEILKRFSEFNISIFDYFIWKIFYKFSKLISYLNAKKEL